MLFSIRVNKIYAKWLFLISISRTSELKWNFHSNFQTTEFFIGAQKPFHDPHNRLPLKYKSCTQIPKERYIDYKYEENTTSVANNHSLFDRNNMPLTKT